MTARKIKILVVAVLMMLFSIFCGCVQPVNNNGGTLKEPPTLSGGDASESNDIDKGDGTGNNEALGDEKQEENNKPIYTALVEFLDVGDGECIIVRFPDGKKLVIDSGAYEGNVTEKVLNKLKDRCGDYIDYLLVTHPDEEHIGNVRTILNNFGVGKMFIPKVIAHMNFFPEYKRILDLAKEKGIQTNYSDFYDYVLCHDYLFAFLTPSAKGGSYARFNGSIAPSEGEINDLSPIIYLDINGVRFVLTGDATNEEEQLVLKQNDYDFYNLYLNDNNMRVDLKNVEFLKVSDGGSVSGSSQEFLSLLKAQNAVICVAGDSYSDNPDSGVLKRLLIANATYACYRTDVYGDIGVYITDNGEYLIYTEA